ncbi:MAG: PrgI family protein [Patescibacteria group bacterium]|nr:PrgI family protein [Patescibacteria group bacterium]
MQFQVPQFIETEDKIIGPLTLKQFLYVAAAAIIIFILHYMLNFFIWLVFSIIIAGAGLALAFVKINGQNFQKMAYFMFQFYWAPQNYLWQPENPNAIKTESSVRQVAQGFSLESLVSGATLKNTWQKITTTKEPPKPSQKPPEEKYEIVKKSTGEREAIKVINY